MMGALKTFLTMDQMRVVMREEQESNLSWYFHNVRVDTLMANWPKLLSTCDVI